MLYVAAACLLAWAISRKVGRGWAAAALLITVILSSYLVVNDVRTAGVVRDDSDPDHSVVYYSSTALFPFVVQKQNNWTERTFFYRVLFLSQDGFVTYEGGPSPDQSEYMHEALFEISAILCFMGFFFSAWVVVCAELVSWWRRTPHAELAGGQSSGM